MFHRSQPCDCGAKIPGNRQCAVASRDSGHARVEPLDAYVGNGVGPDSPYFGDCKAPFNFSISLIAWPISSFKSFII